jgi:hypothetical protein
MPLVSTNLSTHLEAKRHACGTRTGTRTEADFSIDLGFTPTCIKVINLTDRIQSTLIIDSTLDAGANVKGLRVVSAGTTTYAAVGITLDADERGFSVAIAVALITDNDDVYWEAWS